MRKVAHYKSGIYLPLTENWIYGQITNLKRYSPVVYCHSTVNLDIFPLSNIRSLEFDRGIKILNKIYNRLFRMYPFFGGALIKDKPALVHAHFGPSGYRFMPLKKIFKVPLITTFYGYDVNMLPTQQPKWQARYKRLFAEGECFLTEGNYMKKCLVDRGCPEEKVFIQHLGVDLDRIRFMPRDIGEDGYVRILIAGSFREKKGIPYAIEAVGLLKRENPGFKIKVTVIGDSTGQVNENVKRQEIFDKASEYDLGNVVVFLGYQQHSVFIDELHKHHIFLSPSVTASDGDTEGGLPVSIIEALASGMPVVSTRHCDIPEAVIDGKNGYLVAERDSGALAERLKRLISEHSSWKEMGVFGRRHIEDNYDVRKQSERLETVYDRFARK